MFWSKSLNNNHSMKMPTCKFLLCHALGILQDYISYHGYSLTDNTEASITFLSISVQDETEILDLFPNETRILFDGLTLWLEMAEKRLDLMGRDFDEGSTSDDEQLVRRTKVRKYQIYMVHILCNQTEIIVIGYKRSRTRSGQNFIQNLSRLYLDRTERYPPISNVLKLTVE